MAWHPSHEPDRYDRAPVARLAPIRAAVDALALPLRRKRKLAGVLNAIEMQIEDGGDSPEVNALLLDALRAGVRHQVDERAAQAVLCAIDAFAAAEVQRWVQLRAGTLPPVERTPQEQLDDLMQEGYRLQQAGHTAAACDRWMAAWNLVRQLAQVEMRTSFNFGRVYSTLQSVYNWSVDVAYELGNAGVDNPVYYEQLLRFTREYLALFPDEESDRVLSLLRAQGEALWFLGRQPEAEQVYVALVEQLPDEGWGYIGWADHYWMYRDSPQDYRTAVAILERALVRPALRDREYVLERLANLYSRWGKPQEQAAVVAQQQQHQPRRTVQRTASVTMPQPSAPPAKKPGRNDPCWCGSGRKYKQCHLGVDAQARRGRS
jgi:tetratricopeptide (TPR) repeat protein